MRDKIGDSFQFFGLPLSSRKKSLKRSISWRESTRREQRSGISATRWPGSLVKSSKKKGKTTSRGNRAEPSGFGVPMPKPAKARLRDGDGELCAEEESRAGKPPFRQSVCILSRLRGSTVAADIDFDCEPDSKLKSALASRSLISQTSGSLLSGRAEEGLPASVRDSLRDGPM